MKLDDLSGRQKHDLASCFACVAAQELDLNINDVSSWINYGGETFNFPDEWSFTGYLDEEEEASEEEIEKAEREGEISEEAQKVAIDVLTIKFKLLIEFNPEIFLKDINLFRNIKNILWEEFENLEICDGNSDEWNEFIDRVNDFE